MALGTFKVCTDEDGCLGGAAILAAWRLNLGRLVVGCFVGLHISATQVCREVSSPSWLANRNPGPTKLRLRLRSSPAADVLALCIHYVFFSRQGTSLAYCIRLL